VVSVTDPYGRILGFLELLSNKKILDFILRARGKELAVTCSSAWGKQVCIINGHNLERFDSNKGCEYIYIYIHMYILNRLLISL
jgi:hypothetical protein